MSKDRVCRISFGIIIILTCIFYINIAVSASNFSIDENEDETYLNVYENEDTIVLADAPDITIEKIDGNFTNNKDTYTFNEDMNVNFIIKSDIGLETVCITLGDKTIVDEKLKGKMSKEYFIDIEKYLRTDSGRLKITVTDIIKNKSVNNNLKFIRDDTPPFIGNIICNGRSIMGDGYVAFKRGECEISTNIRDYDNTGKETEITGKVYGLIYSEDNRLIKTVTMEKFDNFYSLDIEPEFCGYISILATDDLSNKSDLSSGRIIIGKDDKKYTNISKNSENIRFFKSDTSIFYEIDSSFCGINRIDYSVIAPYDKNKNYSASFSPNTESDEYFTVTGKKGNLITSVRGRLPIKNNSNDIVVRVSVTDNFKDTYTRESTVNIDKSMPKIDIELNHDISQGFLKEDLTAKVTVVERNFSEDKFNFNLSDENGDVSVNNDFTYYPNTNDPDKDKYVTYINFDNEGEYAFGAEFTDDAGNYVKWVPFGFVIDKSKPKISVYSDDSLLNDKYTNGKHTISVVVEEDNLDLDSINFDGNCFLPDNINWTKMEGEYLADIEFSEEGEYSFSISAKDLAGNASKNVKVEPFIIDKTAPDITIKSPADFSANRDKVEPLVEIYDKYIKEDGAKFDITKDGNVINLENSLSKTGKLVQYKFQNIKTEKDYDGVYVLDVSAKDLAGNIANKKVNFSVNRFGSTYVLDDNTMNINNKYIKAPIDIGITEINVDNLVESDTHAYLAKNENTDILFLNKDFTVEPGKIGYKNSFHYTFPKSLFSEDGVYSLSMHSTDLAGNNNQSIRNDQGGGVSFGIDTNPPDIAGLNISDGDTVNIRNFLAKAMVKDNLKLENVTVKIGDKSIDYKKNDDEIFFFLKEAKDNDIIEIVAEDAAGNVTKKQIKDILIKPAIFGGQNTKINDIKEVQKEIIKNEIPTRQNKPLIWVLAAAFSFGGFAYAFRKKL